MKKTAIFILLAIAAFACNRPTTVNLSGTVSNTDANEIILKLDGEEEGDTIALSADGSFSAQIELAEEHMASLLSDNIDLKIYLVPGADLQFELDNKNFRSTEGAAVNIRGEKSEASSLLLELRQQTLNDGRAQLVKMPVETFENTTNSSIETAESLIEDFKDNYKASDKFIRLAKKWHQLKIAMDYYRTYIGSHHYVVPDDTTEIPAYFQEYIDAIPVDDFELCKELDEYTEFVTSHYYTMINDQLSGEGNPDRRSVAYVQKRADIIGALEVPTAVKDRLGYYLVGAYGYAPDSIREAYLERYKDVVSEGVFRTRFEQTVATIEKTKSGAPAPSFNLEDIDGNMVSSESLKGKVVYIDVWATWCGPCRAEAPHLKRLEKELHAQPIAFVSISIDADKAAWKRMVERDELKGIQLYAEGAWNADIIKAYAINGIPRFILIDKEGKIVDADASRPSNPSTKAKLLELAAK